MIKLVFCARRRAGLSREAFLEYWLNHHGPLFRQHAKAYRALRYVQSHTLDTPLNAAMRASRGTQMEYDGIGEIWWESEDAFRAAVSSEEVARLRQIFIEDEARFIDLGASSLFFTVEHCLLETSSKEA